MSLRYSRGSLLSHDRNFTISQRLKRKLFYFGILRKPSTTPQLPIPVRIHSRIKCPHTQADTSRQRFLSFLPRSQRHAHHRHHGLSFGLLNVRSLHRKVDDILEIQRDHNLDIFLITETWHDSDSVCLSRLRIEGFTVAHQPRPRSREDSLAINHGGVALLAGPCVRLTPLCQHLSLQTFEFVCNRISFGTSSVVIILLYRTGTVTNLFFDELSTVINEIAAEPCPVLITGDFNIHIEKPNDPHTRTLLDLIAAYDFSSRVNVPTHDLGGTLDVVFSRTDSPPIAVNVSDPGVSDHRLVTWNLSFDRPSPTYVSSFHRPWNRLDPNRLQLEIADSALCHPSTWQNMDANELAELYSTCITSILDRLIPLRQISVRPRPSDPWFDDSCREAKRITRRLERRIRRLQRRFPLTSPAHADVFDAARREWKASVLSYRSLLRHKREIFWCSKIDNLSHSPRQMWLNFDRLMGRGRPPPSDLLTASELHQHFDRKTAEVRAATAGAPPPLFSQATVNSTFSFDEVTEDTVITAVRRLPSKSSTADPLHTGLLKNCMMILAPFITKIFNVSLSNCSFPEPWKQALVTPIPKRGCRQVSDPTSYRPISNLTVLSKLLERLAASQIRKFVYTNDLLTSVQSAYRQYHSTETASLNLSSDLLLSIDKGNMCLVCFIDLSSAFDTIDHTILKERLRTSFCFSDSALEWTESFLSDRTQLVTYGRSCSQPKPITHGVPQGSVLGPLLFIMYTSELTRVVQDYGLNLHMYADDIQIYGSCPPSKKDELTQRMESCLDALSIWFQSNRFQLNHSKTEFMWCASAQRLRSTTFGPIRFGHQLSYPVAQVKCLGVTFDSKVSFAPHVAKTVASCFSVLRQIRSVRNSLTVRLRTTLVQSLVLSRLDYCLSILSGLPACLLRQMQCVLHASVRTIFGSSRFASTTPLLRELRWLPIQGRIALRLAVITHQCLYGSAPRYLSKDLRPISRAPNRARLRSSATLNLVVPFARRSTFGERSFPVSAARTWNSLPIDVQAEPRLQQFKHLVNEHLLSIYYS